MEPPGDDICFNDCSVDMQLIDAQIEALCGHPQELTMHMKLSIPADVDPAVFQGIFRCHFQGKNIA